MSKREPNWTFLGTHRGHDDSHRATMELLGAQGSTIKSSEFFEQI
jgi:hypothetical protein